MTPRIRDNDVLQAGQLIADREQRDELIATGNKDYARFRVVENVRHAVRRFLEINRDGDGAIAVNRKVRGMPLGTIGAKEADAVAWLYAKFEERLGEACGAAEKFLARNVPPSR